MRKIVLLLSLLVVFATNAQKFKATESRIQFFSEAPLEDIEAINEKASTVLDMTSGNIVFSIPMNQFVFEKSLMQEHYNENYLETEKYPKALFLGTLDTKELKEGENTVTVSGEMDLHGVKREISVTGTIVKNGDRLKADATFIIALADYNIKIPKAVFYNIAEEIEITVSFTYEKI